MVLGDDEVDDGVVSPGSLCDVAEFYSVAGVKNGGECVFCFVHGIGDYLGEANIVEVLQEGD